MKGRGGLFKFTDVLGRQSEVSRSIKRHFELDFKQRLLSVSDSEEPIEES